MDSPIRAGFSDSSRGCCCAGLGAGLRLRSPVEGRDLLANSTRLISCLYLYRLYNELLSMGERVKEIEVMQEAILKAAALG